ncbi:MAG: hypothetical protein H6719_18430 [Sandaracinaceae bacterium]|nr:hypothetical protein [Sandaracinaceae bacterium]
MSAPTRVRVNGVMADGPLVRSPVTGREAAVIGWFFSERFTPIRGRRPDNTLLDQDDYSLRTAGRFAPAWLRVDVGGRLVRIDARACVVGIASSQWDGEILNQLPEALAHVRVDLTDKNLRYGERWLAPGDTVILDAEVQPVSPEPTPSPYRDDERDRPPPAEYEAVGSARVDDTIGTDLRVG